MTAARLYLPGKPVAEYVFAPPRKWRFDWAWPDEKVAVEQEGGIWIAGRHSRGAGMLKDFEKYNEAAIRGWRVLKFTPAQLKNGAAYPIVARALRGEDLS